MKITDVKPKNDGKKYSVFDSVDKYWKSVEELQKKIEIKSDLDFTNPVNWRNSNTILPAIDYRLHKIQQFIAKRLLEKDKDNPLIIELFISNLAATGKNSESIRMEAKSILIDLGKLYDPQVIDALKQNLYHENSIIRQFSIEILLAKEGMAEDIDEVTHILIKNLSSLDATTRIRA
ncbi:MAG: hypothetical protein JSS53_06935, partial [Proteobacteria bacterium]|nr:hypothetical protein [Pseudomonadota bacterium]